MTQRQKLFLTLELTIVFVLGLLACANPYITREVTGAIIFLGGAMVLLAWRGPMLR